MVVRVIEPAMERVPEIVMVAIVCQSLNPSHKQVHMKYVSPPIHGEWHETLHARSPDPSALFFARRVWLARLGVTGRILPLNTFGPRYSAYAFWPRTTYIYLSHVKPRLNSLCGARFARPITKIVPITG